MDFKLLQGKHHANGKTYKAGDVVPSACDLEERFGSSRFVAVQEAPSEAPDDPQGEEDGEEDGEEKVTVIRRTETPDTEMLGEDVTDSFEVDSEIFQVLKVGRQYTVLVEDDEIATGLWKKDVVSACDYYLEE